MPLDFFEQIYQFFVSKYNLLVINDSKILDQIPFDISGSGFFVLFAQKIAVFFVLLLNVNFSLIFTFGSIYFSKYHRAFANSRKFRSFLTKILVILQLLPFFDNWWRSHLRLDECFLHLGQSHIIIAARQELTALRCAFIFGNLLIEAPPPTSLPVDQSPIRSSDPLIIIINSPFPRKMPRHPLLLF